MKIEIAFIFCIIYSLIMGFVMYPSETAWSGVTGQYVSSQQADAADFGAEDTLWGTIVQQATSLWDSTIGSALKWGEILWTPLWRTIIPFSNVLWNNLTNPVDIAWAGFIALTRTLISVIAAVLAYTMYKNKRTF